jgi:xylulokinase
MDLKSCAWAKEQFGAIYPPGFFDQLPPIVEVGADVGTLAPYWLQKYGYSPQCRVILGMGDNPAAALTMRLKPGRWGVSLGTSETAYELVEPCFDPAFEIHVLRFALGCMAMDCTLHCGDFASAVRKPAGLTWEQFHEWIGRAPRTNEQCMWVIPGADGKPRYVGVSKDDPRVAGATLRAILYGIKRRFLRPFGSRTPPREIVLTGGMAHDHVPRIVASAFGCPVIVAPDVNRVELGSAVMASHRLTNRPLSEVVEQFCQVGETVQPDPALAEFMALCDANYDGALAQANVT